MQESIALKELPKTIQEALFTARKPEVQFLWFDPLCLYLDRYRANDPGDLRLGPLFSEGSSCASRIELSNNKNLNPSD